jgi:threonine/homoserine/homoserine lactone efflux protein
VITLDQLLAFGVAAFVIIVIPGPSVVFTVGRALAYGRRVALATVVGNCVGNLSVAALVGVGLGVVVQESIVVFTVLKVAGAAYLVWLGVDALRRRREFLRPDGVDAPEGSMASARALRQGYLVGVTNPKSYLMFAAVLPQFVDRAAGHVPVQIVLLGLLAALLGLLSDSVWALVAAQLRSWFNRSPRRGEAMGAAGGLSMIGLGVGLAVSGEPH